MTYEEYKELIDAWNKLAVDAGLRMSNDKPLPITFWKTFLGLKRKVHQDIYKGVHKTKSGNVPAYIVQTIRFAKRLEHDAFLDEVRLHIPLFEADKAS